MGHHHCPGCGARCRLVPRYPWHFCNTCRESLCDFNGRALRFSNASASGGLRWRYDDEDTWQDALAVGCRLHERPVLVTEARFGGIVAQPTTREQLFRELRKGGVNLFRRPS